MTTPTHRAPRWVLDTNVVLSALVRPGGTCGKLRLAWQSQQLVALASSATVAELVRVLAYPKFRLTPEEQHDLLSDYLPWVEAVRIPDPAPATPDCRDPCDVPFLQLAVAASAEALVTGDADLHALAPLRRLEIITPAQAIERLSG